MIEDILSGYPIQTGIIENVETTKRIPEVADTGLEVHKAGIKTKRKRFSSVERLLRDKEALLHMQDSSECRNKINEEERKSINMRYWKLGYNERKNFVCQVTRECVKRRQKGVFGERKRSGNYQYSFKVEGVVISVSQKLFLETRGYSSNQVLKTALKDHGEVKPNCDKRGKSPAVNALSEEKIRDIIARIKSYDPQISNYRRAHAPNRLYLPSTLGITKMYKAYLENGFNVSYDIYRREVNKLNISFTKLGQEECEVCTSHAHHSYPLPEKARGLYFLRNPHQPRNCCCS